MVLDRKFCAIVFLMCIIGLTSCKEKTKKNVPLKFKNEKQQSLSEDDLNILEVDKSSMKKISIIDNYNQNQLELKGKTTIETAWYVPLETTEKNLIGDITKIEITENKIFILDDRTSNLFVFSKDGKFLNRIGEKGKGPREYRVVRDFTIDKQNEKVIIYDDMISKLLYYNYDGEFTKKENFPFRFWNFCLNKDTFFFYTGSSDNMHLPYVEKFNIAIRDLNDTFTNKFAIPVNPKRANFVASNHFSSNSQSTTFSLGVDKNIIYGLSSDKVLAMYKIDFGKREINENHLQDDLFRKSIMKECTNLNLALYNGNHLISENYVYFKFIFNNIFNHVIYNKNSGNILVWNKFDSNDPYSLFKIAPLYITHNEDIFVTTIDPFILSQISTKIVDNKSEKFKQLYSSVKEGDNPILLFYKVKDMNYEK